MKTFKYLIFFSFSLYLNSQDTALRGGLVVALDFFTTPQFLIDAKLGNIDKVNRYLDEKGIKESLKYKNFIGNNLLHVVSCLKAKGSLDLLRKLLSNDIDVNVRGFQNIVPLHLAVSGNQTDKASLLLEHGANLELKDSEGLTPLCYAVMDCNENIFDFLVSKGAKIDTVTNDGRTLLHFAASFGCIGIAKKLLDEGLNINAKNENRTTPIRFAARHGQKEMVKFLLNKGAKAKKTGGFTLLHATAAGGHIDTAKFLLSKGFDINAKAHQSLPLDMAIHFEQEEMVKFLLYNGASTESLLGAFLKKPKVIFELLFSQGADVADDFYLLICPLSEAEVSGANIESIKSLRYAYEIKKQLLELVRSGFLKDDKELERIIFEKDIDNWLFLFVLDKALKFINLTHNEIVELALKTKLTETERELVDQLKRGYKKNITILNTMANRIAKSMVISKSGQLQSEDGIKLPMELTPEIYLKSYPFLNRYLNVKIPMQDGHITFEQLIKNQFSQVVDKLQSN